MLPEVDMLTAHTERHRIAARYGLAVLFAMLLAGCGVPGKERVLQDFKHLFAKEVGSGVQPIITSVGPGEGDSENVYQHIKFDVVPEENAAPQKGWLAGTMLNKGQRLYGGEVVVLYQKKSGSEWVIARYDLTRLPGRSP
jgi:hypothetical protein